MLASTTNCELREENERGEITMCTFFENLKEEGRAEGIGQGIVELALKKYAKNLPVTETADMLETDINLIQQIYDIKAANPGYGEKEIFDVIWKQKQ